MMIILLSRSADDIAFKIGQLQTLAGNSAAANAFKKWQGCEEIQWRSFIRYIKSTRPGKESVGPGEGMSEKPVTDETDAEMSLN